MKPSWSLTAQRFPPKTPQLEENTTHAPVELHIKPKHPPFDFSYNSSSYSKDSLGSSLLIWNRETEKYVWWRTCNIKCQDISHLFKLRYRFESFPENEVRQFNSLLLCQCLSLQRWWKHLSDKTLTIGLGEFLFPHLWGIPYREWQKLWRSMFGAARGLPTARQSPH